MRAGKPAREILAPRLTRRNHVSSAGIEIPETDEHIDKKEA
jgi:hypothetical protein